MNIWERREETEEAKQARIRGPWYLDWERIETQSSVNEAGEPSYPTVDLEAAQVVLDEANARLRLIEHQRHELTRAAMKERKVGGILAIRAEKEALPDLEAAIAAAELAVRRAQLPFKAAEIIEARRRVFQAGRAYRADCDVMRVAQARAEDSGLVSHEADKAMKALESSMSNEVGSIAKALAPPPPPPRPSGPRVAVYKKLRHRALNAQDFPICGVCQQPFKPFSDAKGDVLFEFNNGPCCHPCAVTQDPSAAYRMER